MESKQYVKGQSATSTRVKPEKFPGSGKDTDFHAFLDQVEACARMNSWDEKEKANQLILSVREKARVAMSQLSSNDKSLYGSQALRGKIGMHQVPEAAKATLKALRKKVGETLLDLSIDIKRLCGEAYPTLNPASLEQACTDHFTDALGATLVNSL